MAILVLGAVMLGARVIEKHFTDDNKGQDLTTFCYESKVESNGISNKRFGISNGGWVKRIEKNELNSSVVQRRGIRANQKLNKGSIIREHMLDYLRPCPFGALRPCDKKKIINKKLKKDIKYHEIIKSSDVF